MLIFQIEHKVPQYDGWKKAFDSDPINRKKSGVRQYQVYKQADDPNNVIIDLYFDNAEDAQATPLFGFAANQAAPWQVLLHGNGVNSYNNNDIERGCLKRDTSAGKTVGR